MLYISYIKLTNFIQLKGRVYERYYDPFKIYMFMGANGSGKSSIVAEHDPRPVVHGSTTILRDREGIKEIVYKDTEDLTLGYKVVHYYIPREEKKKDDSDEAPPKHSVKSFLYKLYNDEIADTIVNGSTNEFREKMYSVFDVDYDSIKITGIGMKYGGSLFDILSCSDSDRYNYIKSVLSNLEEVKKRELHITTSLQVSNRRLKDLKSVLGEISNVDFTAEMEKLKLDITDYSNMTDNITRDKIKLDNEFEKIHMISPSERTSMVEEYRVVKDIYDVVKDRPDFLNEFKTIKEDLRRLNFSISVTEEELAKLIAEKLTLTKNSDILDRTRILENITREINQISAEKLEEYDLDELDRAIDVVNGINNNVSVLASSSDINIQEYAKYNSESQIASESSNIYDELRNLTEYKDSLRGDIIPVNEEALVKLEVPENKDCATCPLHQLRKDIIERIDNREKSMFEIDRVNKEIYALTEKLTITNNMRRMYTYYADIKNKFAIENVFLKEYSSLNIYDKIHKLSDISASLRGKKQSTMQLYKLRDLTNKKKEIEGAENILHRISELDSKINELELKKNEYGVDIAFKNADPLNRLTEENVYKYSSNLKETLDKLYIILKEMSELNNKSKSIQDELSMLDNKYNEMKGMINRKTEELTKLMVEKERYDKTSSEFKFELEDTRKLNILKVALTKKIPTILLNSYMIFVKNEANELLAGIDRYSVNLPKISYQNNRNEFDIPIRDYDEVKSCAVLSKGESNLISLAIVLPIIYMSTKYRVLRLDELDSTLDVFMKQKVMDIILGLPHDKIVQVLMVTHGTEYADHERVEVIKVAA